MKNFQTNLPEQFFKKSTKMDKKLNNHGITKLINLYRLRPALWDRNSSLYWRRDLKSQAYEEIALAMGLSTETIKKKLHSIRSTYNEARKRMSGKTSSRADKKCAPTLFWYSEMNFLEDSHATKDSLAVPKTCCWNDAKAKRYKKTGLDVDISSEIEDTRTHSPRSSCTDERTNMSTEIYDPEMEENYSSTLSPPAQMNHIDHSIETEENLNYTNEPEISHQESYENKCCICLEEGEEVDWNDRIYGSQVTYKNCYYKYTQLEYDENLSAMLCRNCCNGLEYIDAFIAKAIEALPALQKKFDLNMIIKEDENDIKYETNFETIIVEEADVKPEIQNLPVYEESREEFITAENETFTEKCSSSIKQTKEVEMAIFQEECLRKKTIKEPVCCTICSKILCSKYEAVRHEKTHSANRERNESCSDCGMKFFNKEILRAHMETHRENRKKYKCDFCDKAFYNKSGLSIHRRIHLGQMIPCALCTKKYCRQVDLDKHMASHSASRINSDLKTNKKCFVPCKHCGENVRSTSFKSHMAKHMNEPLFRCSICDKEFFHRKSISKHLKKAHEKAKTEVANFIIVYKKNRVTHLFMQQYANEEISF